MEFLTGYHVDNVWKFFARLKPRNMMNIKNSIEGINARDNGATFVSVKFSRSFV